MREARQRDSEASSSRRLSALSFGVDFAISVSIGAASYAMAGASLGFLFAPVFLTTLAAPQLILAEPTLARRALAWALLVVGVGMCWSIAAGIGAGEVARCAAVLAAYLLALGGIAMSIRSLRVPPILASAIVVILGLAWLTWPVWLSPELTGPSADRLVAWLTPAHPLLAINGVVLARFDAWDRYRLAYQQLTTLNQDVMYRHPRSIVATLVLHGTIGLVGILLSKFCLPSKREPSPDHSLEPQMNADKR